MMPTYIWTKDVDGKTIEVVGDERQAEELTALGFAQKLDGKKKPIPGPTADEIAAQLVAQEPAA